MSRYDKMNKALESWAFQYEQEDYYELVMDKCKVILTKKELNRLLQSDIELFKVALQRGKAFTRAREQKARERAKYERER